jgi:hypothetical protein
MTKVKPKATRKVKREKLKNLCPNAPILQPRRRSPTKMKMMMRK